MLDFIFNVVTYNRVQMATESIMKLVMRKPNNSVVDVIDDCSNESLFELEYLLNEPLHSKFAYPKNQLRQNKENLGVELNNINRLNHYIYNDEEQFVYLTDNDVMYSHLFFLELYKLKELMQKDESILSGTLFNFNTGCHFEIKPYNENYIVKSSFGGVSMLIRVKDFKAAMQFYQSKEYNGANGWDWAICHYAKVNNKLLVSTKNSYVQHIGKIGVNSTEERYDYANNFLR